MIRITLEYDDIVNGLVTESLSETTLLEKKNWSCWTWI